MKFEDFDDYRGKEINAKTRAGNQITLKLEQVEQLEPQGVEQVENVRSEPFMILFSCSKDDQIEGQIVEVELDEFDSPEQLYLKPANQKEDRIIYESIVN